MCGMFRCQFHALVRCFPIVRLESLVGHAWIDHAPSTWCACAHCFGAWMGRWWLFLFRCGELMLWFQLSPCGISEWSNCFDGGLCVLPPKHTLHINKKRNNNNKHIIMCATQWYVFAWCMTWNDDFGGSTTEMCTLSFVPILCRDEGADQEVIDLLPGNQYILPYRPVSSLVHSGAANLIWPHTLPQLSLLHALIAWPKVTTCLTFLPYPHLLFLGFFLCASFNYITIWTLYLDIWVSGLLLVVCCWFSCAS